MNASSTGPCSPWTLRKPLIAPADAHLPFFFSNVASEAPLSDCPSMVKAPPEPENRMRLIFFVVALYCLPSSLRVASTSTRF